MILGDFGSMAIRSSAFEINPVIMDYTYRQCTSTPARRSLLKISTQKLEATPFDNFFKHKLFIISGAPKQTRLQIFRSTPHALPYQPPAFHLNLFTFIGARIIFVQKHLISFFHFPCSCRSCFNRHQTKRLKQIFHDRACIGQSHA